MNYKDIISCFSKNPEKGLTQLFEHYGSILYGYSLKRFELSEDEAYDALYKTFESIGNIITRYQFDSELHFENWIFKIHKNNILQILRKRKNNIQTVSFDDWATEFSESGEETDLTDYREIIEHISGSRDEEFNSYSSSSFLFQAMQKAMNHLSGMEKDILLLRMNNYTYDEIAQMLKIENNQLKVKFSRAKSKLEKKTLQLLKENHHEQS